MTAEQRFAPSPRMAVTYGYDYSRSHIFEPEPLPGIPPLELQANVARLTGTYAWDRRNDPFSPQDGWFHSSGVELGAKALGSDLRFVRYLAQQHYYRTVRRRLVLASAFRLGSWPRLRSGSDSQRTVLCRRRNERARLCRRRARRSRFLRRSQRRQQHADSQPGSPVSVVRLGAGVAFIDAGNVFPKSQRLLA